MTAQEQANFIKKSPKLEVSDITFIPFDIERDCPRIAPWVTQQYAQYWGLLGKTLEQVIEAYRGICATPGTEVFLGYVNQQPCCLLETYDPAQDPVAKHYTVQAGDRGMHILVAPTDAPIANFTYLVLRSVISFIFEKPNNERIVVEPDNRNQKIHQLNKRVGIVHERVIQLPDKQAYLGFATRKQFEAACKREDNSSIHQHRQPYAKINTQAALMTNPAMINSPATACEFITPAIWQKANLHLMRKIIAEFSHERILTPQLLEEPNRYRLPTDHEGVEYQFSANRLTLDHWQIDRDSICKKVDGEKSPLNALQMILELQQSLNIQQAMLPTYLEEISSTLYSYCYKLANHTLTAEDLTTADYQQVEATMFEGHPCFAANSGRIGFNAQDFRAFTPESAAQINLLWIAARKEKTHFASVEPGDYTALIAQELDATEREQFNQTLLHAGVNPDDYLWIPVHPWQWFNKLAHVYAIDIANQDLICLGYGDDTYQAQQSIRTFFNTSQPQKHYVKTALSVLNMGFMRGLSAYYMRTTPAINQWLYQLIEQDVFLQDNGFKIIRESSAIGYSNPIYESEQLGNNPYKKMLAALWRENPLNQISDNQRLMTMASLLHVDQLDQALVVKLIDSSNIGISRWLVRYFDAYLTPLLHFLYQYDLVYMPHGENVILRLEDNIPVSIFMKDIGEEICLLNSERALPEGVERISVKVPNQEIALAVFTDIFDCFFRFLSAILVEHGEYPEEEFWRLVAKCISQYQAQHPELADKFKQIDLFAESFALSCLNRLQLRNNQQMVDLTDPSAALQFVGNLNNPIAAYKPKTTASTNTTINTTGASS